MKIQACKFTRTKNSDPEKGIAFQDYFDSNEVAFIVDELGKKVIKLWDYQLINPSFENFNVGIDLDSVVIVKKISCPDKKKVK